MNQPTAYFAEVYGEMFKTFAQEQQCTDGETFAKECKCMVEDLEFLEVAEHTLAGRLLQAYIDEVDWTVVAKMQLQELY